MRLINTGISSSGGNGSRGSSSSSSSSSSSPLRRDTDDRVLCQVSKP